MEQQQQNTGTLDPSAPISHSAPLVPAVVLRANGELSLQMVRMPADVNMHRKAGLKTPTGGFGRVRACAGLWPGWYLWARPLGGEEAAVGATEVGAVVGPAVFLALDVPPPDDAVETVLDPCPDRTTVDAVRRMRLGEAPPPVLLTPAAVPPIPRDAAAAPTMAVAVAEPVAEPIAATAAAAPKRKSKLNPAPPAARRAVKTKLAASATGTTIPATTAVARKKKTTTVVAAPHPHTLADFAALQPEPYDEETEKEKD
jgi:hypothetical protein